ncbi:hypothetical protein ACFQX6_27525 [Streptosporangium lutulentum]
MSENPEDLPRESADPDRTRRIDQPSPPGLTQPGQSHTQQGWGHPRFDPPPDQNHPRPDQGQGHPQGPSHTQQGWGYPQGQGYAQQGQSHPPSGQGYGYPPPRSRRTT